MMNDNEKYIQEFVKDIPFEDAGIQHRDALKKELLNAFPAHRLQPKGRRSPIWRTIMTSKMTRPAVAAAVVLAAVLAMMSDWMRVTSPAFGLEQIGQAMRQVEYAHLVWKVEESNLDAETAERMNLSGREWWTARHPPRQIQKYGDGRIYCTEEDTGRVLRYDPENNVIVVKQESPSSLEDLQMTTMDRLTRDLVRLEKQGATVEYGEAVYQGQPVTTITVDFTPGRMRSVISLMVDPDTHLLKKLTLEQTIREKGWRAVMSAVADYPDSGPTDIYEAGAPRDAKILVAGSAPGDSEPDAQSVEVIKLRDAARERLPRQWTLIAVDTGQDNIVRSVTVVYADNRKERWESYSWGDPRTRPSAEAVPVSKGLPAVEKWARARDYSRGVTSLYDGRYMYSASYYHGAWHIQDRQELKPSYGYAGCGFSSDKGLYWLGWPKTTGRVVENAYAGQRGLICLEDYGGAVLRDGRVMQCARRTLHYLDPGRDYMCIRTETYRHVTRPRPDGLPPKIKGIEFDPYSTPSEPTRIRDVVEYGRFETGQLYPMRLREVSSAWTTEDGRWALGRRVTLTHVYIQTHPEFPEGVFDPDHPGPVPWRTATGDSSRD